jgi:hypothetical protein
MLFSFVSQKGDALPLAGQLLKEGHTVSMYVASTEARSRINGTCTTTKSPYLGSDAIIIFDSPGGGSSADTLRRNGNLVLGSSEFSDSLQLIPGYASTLTGMAEWTKIPKNYDIEAWFNGEDWIVGMTNVSVVDRRFLTGGLGVEVDFVGLTACFFKRYRPTCFKETLYKLGRFLKKVEYRGPIAIRNGRLEGGFSSAMVHVYPLLLKTDIAKLLVGVADGTLKKVTTSSDYVIAARTTLPPFPYGESTWDEVVAVVGPTISEARYTLNKQLHEANFPDTIQYRTDLGAAAQRVIPNLLKEDTISGRSAALVQGGQV